MDLRTDLSYEWVGIRGARTDFYVKKSIPDKRLVLSIPSILCIYYIEVDLFDLVS